MSSNRRQRGVVRDSESADGTPEPKDDTIRGPVVRVSAPGSSARKSSRLSVARARRARAAASLRRRVRSRRDLGSIFASEDSRDAPLSESSASDERSSSGGGSGSSDAEQGSVAHVQASPPQAIAPQQSFLAAALRDADDLREFVLHAAPTSLCWLTLPRPVVAPSRQGRRCALSEWRS